MGLDLSARGLSGELKRALEVQRRYVSETYREQIRRFYGPAWRHGAGGPSAIDFENHAYAWVSIFLPILASGNPRQRSKTPRIGPAGTLAKAVELAGNRNFELTDIKRTIEQLATDWAFKYCISFTSPRPVKGMMEREDPPFRPTTTRISLEDYIWDPPVKQHAECRYQAHRVVRDKDGLLEEAEEFPGRGWNREAILSLSAHRSKERMRHRVESDFMRDDVDIFEFWVPEFRLDSARDEDGDKFEPKSKDGYFGTIFTVAEDLDLFIREPRPFWGPRDGPYTFSGYLYVPDEVVPLSPIIANSPQAEELNAVWSAALQAIRSYKRGVAVSGTSDDLAEKMAEFQDLGVFTVDGVADDISKNMKEIEAGGLTQQHLTMLEALRMMLEKGSGITDAKQGVTTGATATEASIAQMSSGQRMGYMTEKFVQTVIRPIAKKEAWYLAMDPRSRTELGELAAGLFVNPDTGEPIEMPVLVGGPENGDLLEDYDIEIQPISMRFTTEMLEAERAASWEAFLLQTAPMIPQTPYIDWGLVYSRKAEQLGDPALARTINVQKAMMMGQMMLMSQMGEAGGAMVQKPTTTQPRLGIDINRPQPKGPDLKSSEKPTGFTGNSRSTAARSGSMNKGPRQAGASSNTR